MFPTYYRILMWCLAPLIREWDKGNTNQDDTAAKGVEEVVRAWPFPTKLCKKPTCD